MKRIQICLVMMLCFVATVMGETYFHYDFNNAHTNKFVEHDWIDRNNINKKVIVVSNENHVKTAEGLYLSEDAYISIPINEYGDLGDFGLFVKYLFNKDLDSEIARFITEDSYTVVRCIDGEWDLVAHYTCDTPKKHEAKYASDCKCGTGWNYFSLNFETSNSRTNVTFQTYDKERGYCSDLMIPTPKCYIQHKGNSMLEVRSTGTQGVVNHIALRDDLGDKNKFMKEIKAQMSPAPFNYQKMGKHYFKYFGDEQLDNDNHMYSGAGSLYKMFTMTGWFYLGDSDVFDGEMLSVTHNKMPVVSLEQIDKFETDKTFFKAKSPDFHRTLKLHEDNRDKWTFAGMSLIAQEDSDKSQLKNLYALVNDESGLKEGIDLEYDPKNLRFSWNGKEKAAYMLNLYPTGYTISDMKKLRNRECKLLEQKYPDKLPPICEIRYGHTLSKENRIIKCHPYCETCSDATLEGCLQCKKTLHPTGECMDTCPHSMFFSTRNMCDNCHYSCDSCISGSVNHCLSCKDQFPFQFPVGDYFRCEQYCPPGLFGDLKIKECVKACPMGTYPDEKGICRDCHPYCKGCNGPDHTDCLDCRDGEFKSLGTVDVSCYSRCPKGQFANRATRSCQKCHSTCEECSGPSKYDCVGPPKRVKYLKPELEPLAIECDETKKYTYGTRGCVEKCPPAFYPTYENECVGCAEICKQCSLERMELSDYLKCPDGYVKDPFTLEQCITNCPGGFEPDEITNECFIKSTYMEHGYKGTLTKEFDDIKKLKLTEPVKITKIKMSWYGDDAISGIQIFYDGKSTGEHSSWGRKIGKKSEVVLELKDKEYISKMRGDPHFEYIILTTTLGREVTFGVLADDFPEEFVMDLEGNVIQKLLYGIGNGLHYIAAYFMPDVLIK